MAGPASSPTRFSSMIFSISFATVRFELMVVYPDHHPKKNTDGFTPLRTSETFSATGGSFDLTVDIPGSATAQSTLKTESEFDLQVSVDESEGYALLSRSTSTTSMGICQSKGTLYLDSFCNS